MQFPESWLREYCNPDLDTLALADTLTMAGLEVEDMRPVAPPFTGVVVGEIREAVQHPDADRLRVCQVDVGVGDLLTIVCGAPNARVGIRVPCATVGAELPPAEEGGKPFKIRVGKLRGVQSFGMLCSARELGISQDSDGLLELPADAQPGHNVRDLLGLDDTVFTLKLTPNLAHCLSIYGIARELSALTGAALREPEFTEATIGTFDQLPVDVQAPDLCGRFSGRIVRGINPRAATPRWMVERLARCGQRSVNALVDISNYVMFELGRPSHIFDLGKIDGGLTVRWSRPGESLKLLNGSTVTFSEAMPVGVIADARTVESMAGIMGGDASAVTDDTCDIYIEAAFWYPQSVAGRARHFNFSTEASHRFERGVDPAWTVEHIERITDLVLQICGTSHTVCGPVDDQMPNMPQSRQVLLRSQRAARVIGMPVTTQQCHDALTALGLPVQLHESPNGDAVLIVSVPSHRFDLSLEEDLIEEVARMLGYECLPDTRPMAPLTPRLRAENRRSPFALRRALAALGYQETINFSFVQPQWEEQLAGNTDPVRLLNPIASHLAVMRSSLMGSLLQVLKFNVDRKAERVRVFEIGRVFRKDAHVQDSHTSVQGFDQPMRVAALAWGSQVPLQWGSANVRTDFYDAKGDLESLLAPLHPVFEAPAYGQHHPALHPGRSARVLLNGREVGVIGELHPKWCQQWELPFAPMLFELELDAALVREVPQSRSVPRHQLVERDLAVVVKESVTHAHIMQAITQSVPADILRGAVLFDVFRPKQQRPEDTASSSQSLKTDEKSLALRLTLGNDAQPLTDADIQAAVQAAVQGLQQHTGARLRA